METVNGICEREPLELRICFSLMRLVSLYGGLYITRNHVNVLDAYILVFGSLASGRSQKILDTQMPDIQVAGGEN